jgi:hypothetical protein
MKSYRQGSQADFFRKYGRCSSNTFRDFVRVAQDGSPMPGKKEITLWGEEIFQRLCALVAGYCGNGCPRHKVRDLDFSLSP